MIIARKGGNILLAYWTLFSSDTRQSVKRRITTERWTEIYSQMQIHVIWWTMRLFGPMIGQFAPIHHCLLEESKWENEPFLFTQDWVLSLYVKWSQNTQMKGWSCLPNDPKIIVCICSGGFWVFDEMLSYGRITFHFRIRVFRHTRWLFSYNNVFRPVARGYMLFYSVC